MSHVNDDKPRKRPDLPFGRGQILPLQTTQNLFERYACADCDKHGLPHLVNNASELYWEHHPGIDGRTKCTRYGTGYGDSIKNGSLPPEPAPEATEPPKCSKCGTTVNLERIGVTDLQKGTFEQTNVMCNDCIDAVLYGHRD